MSKAIQIQNTIQNINCKKERMKSMDKRREVDEFYWAFEARKWAKINSVSRQAIPETYNTFSKETGPTVTELLQKCFIYTVVHKKQDTNYCPYLRQILTDFQNSFTDTLSMKFAIKILLQIPLHLNGVATLPCEILVYKNRNDWNQRQTRRALSENATVVGELALSQ